jgi:hypothetical protein
MSWARNCVIGAKGGAFISSCVPARHLRAQLKAERDKTSRLKALRLAKEAADKAKPVKKR